MWIFEYCCFRNTANVSLQHVVCARGLRMNSIWSLAKFSSIFLLFSTIALLTSSEMRLEITFKTILLFIRLSSYGHQKKGLLSHYSDNQQMNLETGCVLAAFNLCEQLWERNCFSPVNDHLFCLLYVTSASPFCKIIRPVIQYQVKNYLFRDPLKYIYLN